jgi:hypothetical protein
MIKNDDRGGLGVVTEQYSERGYERFLLVDEVVFGYLKFVIR